MALPSAFYKLLFFQRWSADRTRNGDDHAVHSKKVRGSCASSVFRRASVQWRCRPWHFKLSFFSDEVQIGPETVMTTLYTAKKYAVPALEKHCVDFLKRNLSPDNAFMLLTQVSYHLFIYYFSLVLWIRDILVRIRILGSLPLSNGSGCGSGRAKNIRTGCGSGTLVKGHKVSLQ